MGTWSSNGSSPWRPEQWSGMSLSVFDEVHGWRQTWADSTGNYWALEGSPMPRASPSP